MNATITTQPARPASRRSLFGAVVRVDPAVEAALVGNLLDEDPRDRGELLTTSVIVSPPISEKSKRVLAGVF